MKFLKKLFRELRFGVRLYASLIGVAVLFLLSFFVAFLESFAIIALVAVIGAAIADVLRLFVHDGISIRRELSERLSNGDNNPVQLFLESRYPFAVSYRIIDEIPFQFQQRFFHIDGALEAAQSACLRYMVRPTERGEYNFGDINVFYRTRIGCAERHIRSAASTAVEVYPSYLQMRHYELMAATNRLTEVGVKRIRRRGQAQEFDQIREYVPGDEYRTINWNATARRSELMVNQYRDEKSQPIYSLIDMGRTMQMPFEGMSLLDYAINSTLVISNIAMLKDDKAGLISFSENVNASLRAECGRGHMQKILELLYNQQTRFKESNYELLYATVRRTVHQRSLLFLYTNFETLSSLKRQIPTFRMLSQSHVLCVIFFENTELRSLLESPARTIEDMYIHTIGQKFAHEKKLMIRELRRYGIHALCTVPADLSVNTINKYLELKARGVL